MTQEISQFFLSENGLLADHGQPITFPFGKMSRDHLYHYQVETGVNLSLCQGTDSPLAFSIAREQVIP